MSWQSYVDTSLVGTHNVDQGALCSIAGDSVWAHSQGFNIQLHELKIIADILKGHQATTDKAYGDGLFVAGKRYVLTRVDEKVLYARHGKEGLSVAKSTQAIVIGHHGEHQQAGNATTTVSGLADYLVNQGY